MKVIPLYSIICLSIKPTDMA